MVSRNYWTLVKWEKPLDWGRGWGMEGDWSSVLTLPGILLGTLLFDLSMA